MEVNVAEIWTIHELRAECCDFSIEIVDNFECQGSQSKNVERYERNSSNVPGSFVAALAAVPGHRAQNPYGHGVCGHAHVEDQSFGGAEVVDHQQADDSEDERSEREGIEEIGLEPVGDPKQNAGLDEPSHGDPMGVEADRDGDRDESDGYGEVKEIEDLCRSGGGQCSRNLDDS